MTNWVCASLAILSTQNGRPAWVWEKRGKPLGTITAQRRQHNDEYIMVGFKAYTEYAGDLAGVTKVEPWRCRGCKRLMYNLDAEGRPAEGAPLPNYLDAEHPEVCSLCYQTHSIFTSPYWQKAVPVQRLPRADEWAEYS